MNRQEDFDLEAVYDEKIFPLMAQIIDICREHRMPMFASFLYGRDSSGTDDEQCHFCTTNHGDKGRVSEHFERCLDIVRNGLPEKRLMAFRITKGAK
jgi:hypothetical protein